MSRTLKPEDRISHYRIVGPLGAGGMGEVYRAQDQSLERDVALKILPPELVRSEERVRRFVLEAKSASSLNHPHIVTIYEIGQDRVRSGEGASEPDSSTLHFISMELVSGKTLGTKIHQEKTDLKTLLGWLAQAAEGLAKAHAAGIVHRDLKPGNIMITEDGYAKVLDFGLAKLTERQATGPDLPPATRDGRTARAGLRILLPAPLLACVDLGEEAVRCRSGAALPGDVLPVEALEWTLDVPHPTPPDGRGVAPAGRMDATAPRAIPPAPRAGCGVRWPSSRDGGERRSLTRRHARTEATSVAGYSKRRGCAWISGPARRRRRARRPASIPGRSES